MAQWNSNFNCNNRLEDANTWNSSNGQYVNQNGYYPQNQYAPDGQYVSFNDFISNMQMNETQQNNQLQYQNNSSPSYSSYPSTTTAQSSSYQHQPNYTDTSYVSSSNHSAQNYQNAGTSQEQNIDSGTGAVRKNNVAVKSKLTPTATEFVPKTSITAPPSNEKRQPVMPSWNQRGKRNTNDTNWRDRPTTSSQENGPSYQHQSAPVPKNRNPNFNTRNQEQYQDDNIAPETSKHSEPSPRNKYQGSKGDQRNQENSNKNNQRYKSKSRQDVDSGRMFYNSSANKTGQDGWKNDQARHGNYAGTQRIRTTEFNNVDNEQFANNYLSYNNDNRLIVKKNKTRSPHKIKSSSNGDSSNTELTQRERLSEQLETGTLECLVCCEGVIQVDSVWSCSNCYHVMHLRCIRKWAMSSLHEGKWRCPACQNLSSRVPTEYRCMCGGQRNPEYVRGVQVAHTCGRSCRRARSCPHPCTLLCHPGPCPPCQATVTRHCGCGAETRSVICSSKLAQVCSRMCNKKLNCGVHTCAKECHEGSCEDCTENITQVCWCPRATCSTAVCGPESRERWGCGEECGRVLQCGHHVCRQRCHPPPCPPCHLLPELMTACPCGKMKLDKDQRKSCEDPIPLCGNICAKPLMCGPDGDKHFCQVECHQGACPVCPDKTPVPCRCGHTTRDIPCAELQEMVNNVFCQKKCNKKVSCGRHRCRELCCNLEVHRCPVVCGRMLSCQQHRCGELCHTGRCAPCPVLSFTELTCECGATVLPPPVPCGTRPPACSQDCPRPRPCAHPPHHSCHSGECPPCVVLTTKTCHGGHESRKTIPCSQEEFSCGRPCGKALPCGKHTCIKTCHKGPCDTEKCVQPCPVVRGCGHGCGVPCHSGVAAAPCPSSAPCRHPVTAVCRCGRREMTRQCADNARDYAKMMSTLAASKIQENGSVDLTEMARPGNQLKTLECDDECRVEQRTRQMALALQIRNPDLSSKLAPRYSDHVRTLAAKDTAFAQQIHDKLTELVQLAKKSKQKTRSHSFPSMNRQKRQFIHEMCEHFGCESVAYDAEPNRNVVATADKEKSWLPALSVLEVVSRESGRRRVPGPVVRHPPPTRPHAPNTSHTNTRSSSSGWATLTTSNSWASRAQATSQPAEPKIDYFDNPPE